MKLHRREVLGAGLVSAATLGGCCKNGTYAESVGLQVGKDHSSNLWTERAGIQLYSFRNIMGQDATLGLKTAAAIGFSEVEAAGYFDLSAKEWKKVLDGEGMKSPGSHHAIDYLLDDANFSEAVEAAQIIGHDYFIIPYLVEERRQSIGDYLKVSEDLNKIGEKCNDAGIQLCYHNHEFEFMELEGQIPYDVMLAETDPSLVAWEMDICWVDYAGKSVVEYIQKYPGRFPLFHVKDYNSEGELCPLGEGKVPLKEIFEVAELAGLKHAYYEQDRIRDVVVEAAQSFEYMKQSKIRMPALKKI